jgi:putative endonuclease
VSDERRQHLGRLGEQLAAEHLTRRGFHILERNYRTRWGELDIVAFDGRTLVFCEVKTRRARLGGADLPPHWLPPLESVGRRKRSQVRKMAGRWLSERRDRRYAALLRFDAIGIRLDDEDRLVSLDHLEDAF